MLHYNGTTIGTIRIEQEIGGEKRKFNLQIRQGNCLAVIIHVRKATKEELAENPEGRYFHTLFAFYSDNDHLANIWKNDTKHDVLFGEKILKIRLNMYYKECSTLLKWYTKSGHKVECYYKEPKAKKA